MSGGSALFRIGLENGVEGRSMAWVLSHPGCYTYGADGDAALSAAPDAIRAYAGWVAAHGEGGWLTTDEVKAVLDEVWEVYAIDENYDLVEDGYEVGAWFRHDWKPLSELDVEHGLKLLTWSREELLNAVSGMDAEALSVHPPGERWDMAGILQHVGGAEWWYQDRLGLAFPREQVPDDPFMRLENVRNHLVKNLSELLGSTQVVGIDGEFWSPRKMLRRAVWHERDHAEHIRKLRAAM